MPRKHGNCAVQNDQLDAHEKSSLLNSRLPDSVSMAALATLVLGLIVSAILFVWASRLEYDKATVDVQRRADLQLAALREGITDAAQQLAAVNQLFATVDGVTREQFHTFTQPLLARSPFIHAFGFQRIITNAARPAFEADMRKRYPGFMVKEMANGKPVAAGVRPSYRVIDYLEPMNETIFGLDVSTRPNQDEAIRRARDTGLVSATGLYPIIQKNGTMHGFVMLMPVYRHGVALGDTASRRQAVIGYTATLFRASDLIEKILTAAGMLNASGTDIRVYAGNPSDDDTLVFSRGNAMSVGATSSSLPSWLLASQPHRLTRTFDAAGISWYLVVSASAMPFLSHHYGSLFLLITGILFSLGAAAYLQALTSRSRRVQQLVEERTSELRHINERLTADIAARQRAEQALQLSNSAIEASSNAVIITSATAPDYPVEYVNPAFERITGYASAEVIGRSLRFLHADDGDQPGVAEIRAAVREQRQGHAVVRNFRKDGTPFWSEVYIAPVRNDSGAVTHFTALKYDITATKAYQDELAFHASRDVLTGLANATLLRDRLCHAIAYADRYSHLIWVVFVDLDRFKLVNDTLGHQAGEEGIKIMAERLQSVVREADTVARLGGDTFVLVLPERADESLSVGVIQRMMDAIAQPISMEGHEFFLTCSIGVATYPADGEGAETLIQHADIAMHRAKERGGNNFQFYTPAMNEQAIARQRMERDLRKAVEREEFILHYQPQIDFRTGHIVAAEALIRWNHPELGRIPPLRFIGLAEETGLIVPIGAWVIRTACLQAKAWQDAGLGPVRVAVNLSARQFTQPDLVQSIAAILEATGLAANYLDIELTESQVMTDVESAIAILRALKGLGVHLSIDDFGTGYSSLAYLKHFPIDTLKIDQSFVRDLTADVGDAAIAKAIISMAHSLGVRVIAEGVENAAQCAFLQQHMCDELQGFFFSEPVAPEEMQILLREGRSLPTHLLRFQKPPRTLLLVDDEANILAALKRLLRRENCQVLTAGSGQEGLAILAQKSVDVIISDQRMPGMTGVEFLRIAKEKYPDTVRIVLSGYTELQSVTDAVNESAIYKFLTKPWEDAQLREHIEEAFQRKELADENRRLNLEIQTANQDLATLNRQMKEVLNQRRCA